MHITWHGQYTIKIQTNDTTLVIDPYSPETGLAPFRSKADVVALTNPGDPTMSHLAGIQGEPHIINSPGEYSLRGLTLHAIGWHDGTDSERSLHLWTVEQMTILHLGALNREPSDTEHQQLEKTNIDVLFLPVGNGNGLTTKQALHIVTTVEPRIVIPVHYALPHLKEKLDPVNQFAEEMGVDPRHHESKIILKHNKLPQDEMTVVLLAP